VCQQPLWEQPDAREGGKGEKNELGVGLKHLSGKMVEGREVLNFDQIFAPAALFDSRPYSLGVLTGTANHSG
jgi:hypothetical protein